MQLLKIELRGFKSFADKTVLTFDQGITAIVGPNGSGKSNISDAVRWVMGEQNVRNLRGQKAEDIIFAGTQTRRPQGAAEVSLYFDNTDQTLPIDFNEVVITRRLLRSGDSEYYINKRPCRLKDIHRLFADTGIGQDSMAVIGQNRVDRILNSKPEERRVIFEEVAGISRFKGRKAEGLKKIAETERNLERIRDLMSALEEQLDPLATQAEKLEKFRVLDSERLAYAGSVALQELRNSERLLERAENRRQAAGEETEAVQANLEKVQQERASLTVAREKEDETLRQLDEIALRVHNELDSLVHRHEAARLRQSELAAASSQQEETEKKLAQRFADWQKRQAEFLGQKEQKEREKQAAGKALLLTQKLVAEAQRQAEQLTQELSEKTKNDEKRSRVLFELRRDQQDLQRRLDENEQQLQKALQALTKAESERTTRNTRLVEVTSQQKKVAAEKDALQDSLQALHQSAEAKEKAANQVQAAARAAQHQLTSLGERRRVLRQMAQAYEGLGQAVKKVLTAQAPWRDDLCGVVGDLCQIPEKYALALDVALGGATRYVVAEREEGAKAAITWLKQKKAGRVTFLPLDTIRVHQRTAEEERAVQEEGSLGFASDLIHYEKKYATVFASLLGRIILVDNLQTGSRIAKKYHQRLRLVALDGTQFNPGGSLTGGSNRHQEASFISRKVQLEKLTAAYQAEKEKAQVLQQQAEQATLTAEAARHQRAVAEKHLAELTLQADQAVWRLQEEKRSLGLFTEQLQLLEKESERIDRERISLQAELVKKEEHLHRQEQEPVTANLEDLRQNVEKARAVVKRHQQDLLNGQIKLATLGEQVNQALAQLRQQESWQKELASQKLSLQQEKTETKKKQQETEVLLAELDKNIVNKKQETAKTDAQKINFYQNRDISRAQNQRLEEKLADLRSRQQQFQEKCHQADLQVEKYKGDISRQEEALTRQGLSRQEAMARRCPGSLKELHEQLTIRQRKIAALGPVNPAAAEEYQAARQKRDFYHRQCDDLLASREKLRTVVAEIDQAMAKQFTGAFAEIGQHFQIIFSRLFGGGTAKLELTDSKQILAAGIEIYIQPPGKKRQSLTLLSGGERALTVIALLLAFLAYHPAPFCLVDEVDAALDEANVERMARYLRNYSGATQFIVITHRRKTMEAANTLLGVTMEEKGVSRLLSVKVDDFIQEGE